MLDRRFVAANPERIRRNIALRGAGGDIDAFLEAEKRRLAAQKEMEDLNAASKQLARAQDLSPDEKREQGSALREKAQAAKAKMRECEVVADDLLRAFPNLTHEAAPAGEEGTEIARHGEAKPLGAGKNHLELLEAWGMADFEAGSRVAGPGFYYLKGAAVRLELAMQAFAVAELERAGFLMHIPPELVRAEVVSGTGYNPRGGEAGAWKIEDEDLHLIATSEIPLCAIHADKILSADELPMRLGGLSHCFRPERGAAGQAGKGLFRVHQFSKAEMVILCRPEESAAMHEELLTIERRMFDLLEIPYRVIEIGAGDLGASAWRKYDIEVWMPGRGEKGEYAEATSASNCTDYQARRLNIRWRNTGGKPEFVHTLNGTGLALGRAMIALLENHQSPDGGLSVPKALQPYLGTDRLVP